MDHHLAAVGFDRDELSIWRRVPPVLRLSFSQNGTALIASGDSEGNVAVWGIATSAG